MNFISTSITGLWVLQGDSSLPNYTLSSGFIIEEKNNKAKQK